MSGQAAQSCCVEFCVGVGEMWGRIVNLGGGNWRLIPRRGRRGRKLLLPVPPLLYDRLLLFQFSPGDAFRHRAGILEEVLHALLVRRLLIDLAAPENGNRCIRLGKKRAWELFPLYDPKVELTLTNSTGLSTTMPKASCRLFCGGGG